MLPVVLTTTEDPTTDHFRQYMTGATACFQKPFSLVALMKALQQARNDVCNGFSHGAWMRITRGPLAGVRGRLLDAPHGSRRLLEIPSFGAGIYTRVASDALSHDDKAS